MGLKVRTMEKGQDENFQWSRTEIGMTLTLFEEEKEEECYNCTGISEIDYVFN